MTGITKKERRDREFDGGSSDRGVKSGEIIGLGDVVTKVTTPLNYFFAPAGTAVFWKL